MFILYLKNKEFFISFKKMGQFIKIASDKIGIAKITYLPTSDQDGVYNW